MTVDAKECWVETRAKRSSSEARALMVFFLWILLILAQVCVLLAVSHQETGGFVQSSVPRQAPFLDTQWFQRSRKEQVQPVGGAEGDPEKVYGDDKRIIHTGPNPLHN